MKIRYKLVFTLLSLFIFSIAFSQNTTEKSDDFDVIKLRSILKKRGVADKDLKQEIIAFRERQLKIYTLEKAKKNSSRKEIVSKNTTSEKNTKKTTKSTAASTLQTAAVASCIIDENDRGGYIMLSNHEPLVNTSVSASLSGTYFPSNVYTYSWSLFDPQGALVGSSTDQNFTFIPTVLGEYSIQLIITDQNGCTTTYNSAVKSLDQCGVTENDRAFGIMAPGDYSNYTTLLPINQTYNLTAYFWYGREDYSNLTFDWNFYNPSGVLIATGNNPVFPITLSVPGYHKVVLNVTDKLIGCTSTNSKVIGSLISNSCTNENPKSEVVKDLLMNTVKKLVARSLMGETDQQINASIPDADFNALLPYLKNNSGSSFYNYATVRHEFNENYLADLKFSFSSDRQYDVHFNFQYGIRPYNSEYETIEQLYDRILYELYVNTSQYISYNEQLNSCYMNIGGRMSSASAPVFDPNDCRTKSEIINIDFCPSNCDPITGIIKIIKDTGYPFQFSNSGITSVLACNETAFPNKFYANTQTLKIGTKLYTNQSLSIPVPVSNSFAWYKVQDDTTAYKIDATGKITEIYSCSASTCNKRFLDYVTVVAQEPITLNYFLPNGTEVNKTFEPVPRGGDQTYTFSIGACISETSLTIDGPVLSQTVAWNDNQNCCQATSRAYRFSSPGRDSASEACSAITFPDTFYAASTSLGIGTQLYLDPELKNKVGSGNTWRQEGIDGQTIRIANDGTVAQFDDCGAGQPATTTYGYRAIHPYEHPGTDYVIYIDANGVEQQIDLPRAGAGENIDTAPCIKIVAQRIVSHSGITSCTP